VIVEFGPFRLDEPARLLRLAGRELPLQPRVFDLLVYLVRNRDRVVSKDELLDTLWPGVTVTEGSLQRAASTLRAALREGGLEDAVRSFPRIGYRFCVEAEPQETKPHETKPQEPTHLEAKVDSEEDLAAARRAFSEQRWEETVARYETADTAAALAGADLDRWALALQCLGKPSIALPVLTRSTTAHAQNGNNDAAAAAAVTLSSIHLERGETAVAKGWLARAQELVAAQSDAPATGRLLWMQSRVAAFEGDLQQALTLTQAAYEFGQRIGNLESEALGLMYRGFYKLSLGDTHGGLADQDHAGALALSSNVDPMTGGILYCNILWLAAPSATGHAPTSGHSATGSFAPSAGWAFRAPANCIAPRCWGCGVRYVTRWHM
jgi:DNA-binding winged helix-turn-helix (wHTH) protein